MKVTRRFTKAGENPFDTVAWTRRSSRITNPDGSVVFEMDGAEVPESWTQLATDIMVSKYFRKAGVPEDGGPNGLADPDFDPKKKTKTSGTGVPPVGEDTAETAVPPKNNKAAGTAVPPNNKAAVSPDQEGAVRTGPERSARQVIHRLAGCWRHWGEAHGYFDSEADAQAFYDELVYMLLHQMAAPNSPQWFNTGLNWAYGLNGPAQGHWIADPRRAR